MSDLPVETVTKKEVQLTVEQRLELTEKDIRELARGINTQASLLESIIVAFDTVLKRYLQLTKVEVTPDAETPKV